jgi:hypothetical protein
VRSDCFPSKSQYIACAEKRCVVLYHIVSVVVWHFLCTLLALLCCAAASAAAVSLCLFLCFVVDVIGFKVYGYTTVHEESITIN